MIRLSKESLNLPLGIKIQSITPREVELEIQKDQQNKAKMKKEAGDG